MVRQDYTHQDLRATKLVKRFSILTLIISALAFMPARAMAAELLMMESSYCEWCEKWDEEIGVVYAKTTEGKRAPLKRLKIHDAMPSAYKSIRRANFSPTFILVDGGKEIGRIRGYPGEDFFWPMLTRLMQNAGMSLDIAG